MILDGYTADPHDESDWIIIDPYIDFEEYMDCFDTWLMGHRTFETAGWSAMLETKTVVVSRTLRPDDLPNIKIIGDELEKAIAHLRATLIYTLYRSGTHINH